MKILMPIVFLLSSAWCLAQPDRSQIIHPEIIQFDETSPVIRIHWKNKDAEADSYKLYNGQEVAFSCGDYAFVASGNVPTSNSYYDFTLDNGTGRKYIFNVSALDLTSNEGLKQVKWIPMNPGLCYDFEDINNSMSNYYTLEGNQAVSTGGNNLFYSLSGGGDSMKDSYFEWEIPTGWEIEFYENDQIIVDAPFGAESGYITTKVVSPFTGEESIQLKLPVLVDGVKIDQSINWSTSELVATEGDDPLDMDGTSSADLDVTYHSSNTSVATVSGAQITIVGVGTTTITANQSGDTYHSAAPSVERTLTVAQSSSLDFSANYPQFEYYLSDTHRMLLKLTETGSVYYIVEPNGSTQPTAEQIEAGKNASGADAYKKGVVWSLEADVEYNQAHISGLEESTSYDIYLVLADEAYALQPTVTKLEVITEDTTKPSWSEGYPQMGTISSLEADVSIDLDEETGTVYYAVVRSSSTTLFPANLKNGGTYMALDEGSIPASAAGFTLNNLKEGTDYDVWLVAEDAAENLQSTATKIDFTTIDDIDPIFNAGYPQINTVNETAIDIQARADEQVTVYAVAQLAGNPSPTAQQVISGEDHTGSSTHANSNGLGTNLFVEITGLTAQVAYDLYVVAEDANGNSTNPVKLTATTADQTAPVITPTYLTKVEVTASTATFSFSMNEGGTFYYVLDPYDGSTPSPAQVMNGQIGSGESAPTSGSIVAQADQVYEFQLTGLSENQEYEVYFVAKDENDNISEYATSSYFETSDNTPPVFTSAPEITDVSEMEVSLTAETDEYGTVYAAIIAEETSIPSAADLAALEVEGAIYQGSNMTGYISIFASMDQGANYQLVLIAKDESDNLQANVIALDFTVPDHRSEQVITFELVDEVTFGDANLSLSASNSSYYEVSFKSSDEEVAIIVSTESGTQVEIVGGGTVVITAYHDGDYMYKPAETEQQLIVNKVDQAITFELADEATYGDANLTLNASNSSGMDVFYESSDEEVAIIVSAESGMQVQIVGGGTVEITAYNDGNSVYKRGETSQQLAVNKLDQTINFTTIGDQTLDDSPITLQASATSGLTVEFALLEGNGVISNNQLTITEAGTFRIEAIQPGNNNYKEASSVTQSFQIQSPVIAAVAGESLERPRIYPNPFVSSFEIEIPQKNTDSYELIISGLDGAQVYRSRLTNNGLKREVIELREIPNGIYLVQLTQNNQVKTYKLIKGD